MRQQRHRIVTGLAVCVLLLTGVAFARQAPAASAAGNAELARLYDEDQQDRQAARIDWSVVGKRDAERLKRIKEIAAQGASGRPWIITRRPWSSSTATRRKTTISP
jgi:hypothetical protein